MVDINRLTVTCTLFSTRSNIGACTRTFFMLSEKNVQLKLAKTSVHDTSLVKHRV